MKLCYWRRTAVIPNFGDALNPYIFHNLLGDLLNEDDTDILVGIGTLLEVGMGDKLNLPIESIKDSEPTANLISVFGSGAGYSKAPTIDGRWIIYCVRGPLTAKYIGVDPSLAVADPGILVSKAYKPSDRKKFRFSLMPHHSSATEALSEVCTKCGINYIDPLNSVEDVLRAVDETEILLSEALHGAIVADALRTPCIPIKMSEDIFSFKWDDFCKSVELEYLPIVTPQVLSKIWPKSSTPGFLDATKRNIKIGLAARSLENITRKTKPQLSKNSVIHERTAELERRLNRLREDVARRQRLI